MTKINCRNPSCNAIAVYRGLCIRHYGQLRSKVRRKITTWEEAERNGVCDPQIRGKDGLTPSKRKGKACSRHAGRKGGRDCSGILRGV